MVIGLRHMCIMLHPSLRMAFENRKHRKPLTWQLANDVVLAERLLTCSQFASEVFAWALQCGVSGQAGSNFGRAHRDKSYDDSHTDGRIGMLTTWNPSLIARYGKVWITIC